MNKSHKANLCFAAVLLTGVLGQAQADIKYTLETEMAGAGAQEPKMVALRAVKSNFERDETRTQIGDYVMEQVSIRECGKKQTIKLDPQLKIYTVVPDEAELVDELGAPVAPPATPATGKMVMTYAIKLLGEETISGFKTRHYLVETSIESSGCAGEGIADLKQEIWVSDIRGANPCLTEFSPDSVSESLSRRACKIEVEIKGDATQYAEISKGLVVRQKTYNGEHLLMTTEVTQVSEAKLGDELFAVPAGYKQLSQGEFQDALTEAITKAMTAEVQIKAPEHEAANE